MRTWNLFSINYDNIWNLGRRTDHSTFKIHSIPEESNALIYDEERSKLKKPII